MTKLIEGKTYNINRSSESYTIAGDAGGSSLLFCSYDDGVTFNPVGSLPLPDGELQASVMLSNCIIKVESVTGAVHFKPDVREV